MAPRAVLVGLPGTGKTTTGRRLAKILVVAFTDSDELIEHATGRSIAEILRADGEHAFRALERATVAAALTGFDGVLALGGGAVTAPQTCAAVSDSGVPVVWLRAEHETLLDRVGDAASRPLLTADPASRLAELDRQRRPAYARLATIGVDTDGRTPGQVAATIAARLHELGRRGAVERTS